MGEFAIGTNYSVQQFTRNTLFDEKIGGTFHMALGASIPESGGVNESGYGSELGRDGIRAYCLPKSFTSPRLISTSRLLMGGRWMPRRVGPKYWKALARTLFRW